MNKFIFKAWEADVKKGKASFFYELQNQGQTIKFEEKISFSPVQKDIPSEVLKPIFDSLLLILGISYWKLYCPKIELESISLNKEQTDFWNKVYTKGLGEFFYKNNIDFRNLVQFPYVQSKEEKEILLLRQAQDKLLRQAQGQNDNVRSLVLLGGGKDSIVTAEILKKQGKNFDLFILNNTPVQEKISEIIGRKSIIIKREIDQKLFDLNKNKQTYNGHVPISAIFAFMGLLAAALYDYKYIIASNERSANEGNVEYLGETINHQWSKSFEFEKMFKDYVHNFITQEVSYFSLLRSMSELKITKLFSSYPKYFQSFSSCNHGKWCGMCPKCAFVFTSLSAFLKKDEILKIFGKNLFEDEGLLPLFKELLGIQKFKPFECVGTKEEMQYAMYTTHKKGEFENDALMKMFKKEVLAGIEAEKLEKEVFEESGENLITEEFRKWR